MKVTKIIFVSVLMGIYSPASGNPLFDHHPKWTVGQTVNTTSGLVSGRAASKGVSAYLGIPYAQPPIEALRFSPPKKYKGNKAIDGTKFVSQEIFLGACCMLINNQGPTCPISTVFGGGAEPNLTNKNLTAAGHAALDLLSLPKDVFSEDCLTVNVWTKPQVGERKKAVLLWVYGGGYTLGSSSDLSSDGQHIAEQEDVVVVSFK
jgi:cholinesterase